MHPHRHSVTHLPVDSELPTIFLAATPISILYSVCSIFVGVLKLLIQLHSVCGAGESYDVPT